MELKKLGSWAAFSAKARFGAGDEYFTVTSLNRAYVAAKYNVALERVIEANVMGCSSSTECIKGAYIIEPIKPNKK